MKLNSKSKQHAQKILGATGRAIVLDSGTIAHAGPSQHLIDHPNPPELFLGG